MILFNKYHLRGFTIYAPLNSQITSSFEELTSSHTKKFLIFIQKKVIYYDDDYNSPQNTINRHL